MNTDRINKIISSMKSFSKDTYERTELLDEMFRLQEEMVNITFSEEHANKASLRIWDVESHLEHLNSEAGHVADELLLKFKNESKEFCNLIKSGVSGNKGESKAFKTLEFLSIPNAVIKNVELKVGDSRTELDAVVITTNNITIVEVKNTSRDVFIDEWGNYFRVGEIMKYDSPIGDKLQIKESLLRTVLGQAGYEDIGINSVVVFTDNRIEVQNKCPHITVCFLNQLNSIIESAEVGTGSIDIDLVSAAVDAASNKEAYPIRFDVEQYKKDFAELVAILEEASNQAQVSEEESSTSERVFVNYKLKETDRFPRYLRRAAAAVGITAVFFISCAAAAIRKGVA